MYQGSVDEISENIDRVPPPPPARKDYIKSACFFLGPEGGAERTGGIGRDIFR